MPRRRADPSRAWDGVAPLERPGPLRHRVQESLRELIIARTLAPGEHLVETELAARLNVSRGPVREALQALHSQGWVELRPGKGAFVHQPADDEVEEVFVVRAALESEAAALAASHTDAKAAKELRRVCGVGRSAVESGDDAAVVAANSEFHRRVAALSGVELLTEYISSLDRRVRWLYKPLVRSRGLDSWIEHEQIVAALQERDRRRAARLMREHSERTRKAYQKVAPDTPHQTPNT